MTHYTSPYTGNTAYYSEDKLFSSMSKEAVLEFEDLGIKTKFDLDRKQALKWSFAGQCKIASEYLNDWAIAGNLRWQYLKDNKKGNYCPLKVNSRGFKVFKKCLEDLGYEVGPEYR